MSYRADDVIDQIAAALALVKISSGYATDIQNVYRMPIDFKQIPSFPSASVFYFKETLFPQDAARHTANSTLSVVIEGYVNADMQGAMTSVPLATAVQNLMQDLRRVVYSLLISQANTAANKWIILADKSTGPNFSTGYFMGGKNAIVYCDFKVQVANLIPADLSV